MGFITNLKEQRFFTEEPFKVNINYKPLIPSYPSCTVFVYSVLTSTEAYLVEQRNIRAIVTYIPKTTMSPYQLSIPSTLLFSATIKKKNITFPSI